ncbi:hypothetical protein MRX96_009042 [Rhipicephalus microplus]
MIYHYTSFKIVSQNVWLSRTSRSIISKQQKEFLGTFHVSNDVAIGCHPFQTLFLLCSMLCCYCWMELPMSFHLSIYSHFRIISTTKATALLISKTILSV